MNRRWFTDAAMLSATRLRRTSIYFLVGMRWCTDLVLQLWRSTSPGRSHLPGATCFHIKMVAVLRSEAGLSVQRQDR